MSISSCLSSPAARRLGVFSLGRGALAGLLLAGISAAGAGPATPGPMGPHRILLSNAAGEQVELGRVSFEPAGEDRWRFKVKLDADRTSEHFLAMRPFKCLTGPKQQICHFPYEVEPVISRSDLVPLEYALMFLHKKPSVPHIGSRNGHYYRLRWAQAGGTLIEGRLHDVDMDPIIAPKGNPERPIVPADLAEADENSHWMTRLHIEALPAAK